MSKSKYVAYFSKYDNVILIYDLYTKQLEHNIHVNTYVNSIISFTDDTITYLTNTLSINEYNWRKNLLINFWTVDDIFKIQIEPNINGYFNTNQKEEDLIVIYRYQQYDDYFIKYKKGDIRIDDHQIKQSNKQTRFKYNYTLSMCDYKSYNWDTRRYHYIVKNNGNINIIKDDIVIWKDIDNDNNDINVMILDTIEPLNDFYKELEKLVNYKLNINLIKILGNYIE